MTSPDQNYTSWHVGMKVVCIDAAGAHNLKDRGIYTISKIDAPDLLYWRGGIRECCGIHLVEAKPNKGDIAFAPERFRPVQTRKTDISCFTSMLSPKPAKAKKVRA